MSKPQLHVNRRGFLRTALKTGAILALPQFVPARVLGREGAVPPSEQISLGGIGIGNRGTYDLGCFLEEPDVRFVAVCDIKAERRRAVKKKADDKYGNQNCATYRDLRELLDRSDIDAVLIATGPNWHAVAATLAAKAGKDVYCEKPCTKNIAQSLIQDHLWSPLWDVGISPLLVAPAWSFFGALGLLFFLFGRPKAADR